MSPAVKAHGMTTLTMSSGVTHTLSTRLVLQLLHDATNAMGPQPAVLTDEIYDRFPQLEWFRDAASISSSSGHLHEVVMMLIQEPAPTPTDSPVQEGCSV